MRHLKQQKIRTPYAARVCICIRITSTFQKRETGRACLSFLVTRRLPRAKRRSLRRTDQNPAGGNPQRFPRRHPPSLRDHPTSPKTDFDRLPQWKALYRNRYKAFSAHFQTSTPFVLCAHLEFFEAVIVLPSSGSGVLHRPHSGWRHRQDPAADF